MLFKGLPYGFFSCYNETIFLRVDLVPSSDRPEVKFPKICYSSVIDSDAKLDQSNGNVTVPLRLAMLYVMKLAMENAKLPLTTIHPRGYTTLVAEGVDLDSRGRTLSTE
jgi:hypothetical protein